MLDVIDRLFQKLRNVVVLQGVEDRSALTAVIDQAEGAEEAEFVGDGRLLHPD